MPLSEDDRRLRLFSLHEELLTAISHLKRGLAELQEIDGSNDFYHLPLMLLATGLERICKVAFCFHWLHEQGGFPDSERSFPAFNVFKASV